jgi:hypothetical protein
MSPVSTSKAKASTPSVVGLCGAPHAEKYRRERAASRRNQDFGSQNLSPGIHPYSYTNVDTEITPNINVHSHAQGYSRSLRSQTNFSKSHSLLLLAGAWQGPSRLRRLHRRVAAIHDRKGCAPCLHRWSRNGRLLRGGAHSDSAAAVPRCLATHACCHRRRLDRAEQQDDTGTSRGAPSR